MDQRAIHVPCSLPAKPVRWLRRFAAGVLSVCLAIGAGFGAPQADRRTVFTLIDESGTLKADRAGWRKQAASMLAFALNDGSSMALSGFGNTGRKLDLTPRYLDSSQEGLRNRKQLAALSMALTDTDRQTDLFDAIHQALSEISKLDAAVRESSPPAIVVLSDFQADPKPTETSKSDICQDLSDSRADLLLVGFGQVDPRMADFLASCVGTSPWGTINAPSDLLDVFWRIQRRYTSSLRIFERRLGADGRIGVPIPAWSEEILILAFSDDPAKPTDHWSWTVSSSGQQYDGRYYRLARINPTREMVQNGKFEVQLDNPHGITLSVVARGQFALRLTPDPGPPWLVGESVTFKEELVASTVGTPVTEWATSGRTEYACKVRLGSNTTSLRWHPEKQSFVGSALVPAGADSNATAELDIDGASWRSKIEARSWGSPLDLGLDAQERFVFTTWAPGWPASRVVRSRLPNRHLTVTVSYTGEVGASSKVLTFDVASPTLDLEIRPPAVRSAGLIRYVTTLFSASKPLIGTLSLRTRLDSGQVIQSQGDIPILVVFRPVWMRALVVSVLGIPLVVLCYLIIAGRNLPAWYLVPCDVNGKPIRGRDPVRLANHRRSFALDSLGLLGVAVRRSLLGKTRVRLRESATLRMERGADLNGPGVYPLAVGDTVVYRSGDKIVCYCVDRF
jgi:hypothetical protein